MTTEYVFKYSKSNVSYTLASIPFIIWLLSHHSIGGRECDDTVGLWVSISTMTDSPINVLLFQFPYCVVTSVNDHRFSGGRTL